MKEILRRILLNNYPGITPTVEDLEQLAEISVITLFSKNDYLMTPVKKNKFIGFIIKGMLKTYSLDQSGKEHVHYFCTDGNITGTLSDNLYVQALESTQLIMTTFEKASTLFEKNTTWNKLYREHLGSLYMKNILREEELLSIDAKQRYINLLNRIPDIEKRVHQYDIASYLGITPVALSRIKKSIEKNYIKKEKIPSSRDFNR